MERMRAQIAAAAAAVPWEQRVPRLLFRGMKWAYRSRHELLRAAAEYPGLINAEEARDGDALFMTLPEQCSHRYLAYAPGVTYSARLKYLLLCGAVVVVPANTDYQEWWWPLLTPNVTHFVTSADFAVDGLVGDLRWLRDNDAAAQRMGAAGADLATRYLSPHAVDCYWRRLLQRYSSHLGFSVALLPEAVPIEESLASPTESLPP